MSSTEKSKSKRLRILKNPSAEDKPQETITRDHSKATLKPVCPRCFGTGMEVVSGEGARRCDCQTTDNHDRLFQAARIPVRYRHCTLANYDAGADGSPQSESKWRAKTEAQTLFEHFLELDGRGILYMGGVGVGKTHLAAAILLELIQRYHVRGLFYQFGALLKEIQESYSPISHTSELSVLAPVFEVDVLVLDELGSSKPSDWVRDTMMQIINTRYNDKKLTVFTTNYLDDLQIQRRLAELKGIRERHENARGVETGPQIEQVDKQIKQLLSGENLEDRIGSALRSRLYEMCKTVVIEAEDYRRKPASHRA